MLKLRLYFYDYLLCDKFGRLFRKKIRNKLERRKLKNNRITILSQNCIAGVMYKDLGLEFLSPTINIYFEPNDFVLFVKHLDYYLQAPLIFVEDNIKEYPVGILGENENKIYKPLVLNFVHYKDAEEAASKWHTRKKRINYENIYIICQDHNLTYESLQEFNNLNKFPNKILLASKDYKEFECSIFLKQYERKGYVDNSLNYGNPFGKRKYQYGFDYIKWLNRGIK